MFSLKRVGKAHPNQFYLNNHRERHQNSPELSSWVEKEKNTDAEGTKGNKRISC